MTACVASGGALAPQPSRATGVGPEPLRIDPYFQVPISVWRVWTSQTFDLKFDIEAKSQKKETSDLRKSGEKGGGKGLAIIRGNSGPTPVVRGWLRD